MDIAPMTYFEILGVFVGIPLVLLTLLTWYDHRRGKALAQAGMISHFALPTLLAHVAIALVYTSPWDNYLVATDVWWYDDNLVTGITTFWVPIEEYTFFIVQTLMSGLFLLVLSRYIFTNPPTPLSEKNQLRLRLSSTAVLGVVWLASLVWLLSGWREGTYLGLILVWALIPIMVQLSFGADILWSRLPLIFTSIFITTTYLNFVDALAIGFGTWVISPEQTTGLKVGGILPIEEATFFMITNVLVVFGITLMLAEESQERIRSLVTWGQSLRTKDRRSDVAAEYTHS